MVLNCVHQIRFFNNKPFQKAYFVLYILHILKCSETGVNGTFSAITASKS